jgi:hypothetical protein
MMKKISIIVTQLAGICMFAAFIQRPVKAFGSEPVQRALSQEPKSKSNSQSSDSTFTLKIENEKRVVDEKLKTKLSRELKTVIAKYQLKKPYKIAMGFTRGARDVETFLFGEQIFYAMAESGFVITGTPLDMPDETPNITPQVKVINNTIYIILSRL